jgi:DNA helicase-2/ATP-dependent DNA helicase PcrA
MLWKATGCGCTRHAPALSWTCPNRCHCSGGVLDLFYRLCGFDHFRGMFDLAECGEDEGPICNLGLISQYLSRFMDEYGAIITASLLQDEGMPRVLFSSYLFALFRRGESEYEDAEDPFPKGRIPFLTIHQAKGLEFPVVVLGNARKDTARGPQRVECLVHPLLGREGEPLDRMAEFDAMRLFYVALSRAKNLLVIAHPRGPGQRVNPPFQALLDDAFPRIPQLDVAGLPVARLEVDETPHSYSYTGDYLYYGRCPRQYMIFRKYGFVPSRSQTMMFGSLVHRTLDDLHQLLIARRSAALRAHE